MGPGRLRGSLREQLKMRMGERIIQKILYIVHGLVHVWQTMWFISRNDVDSAGYQFKDAGEGCQLIGNIGTSARMLSGKTLGVSIRQSR